MPANSCCSVKCPDSGIARPSTHQRIDAAGIRLLAAKLGIAKVTAFSLPTLFVEVTKSTAPATPVMIGTMARALMTVKLPCSNLKTLHA
ncbi:hypothetical protein HNQ96_004389 [Aminobacter lissarensis]|uniref:Uncharacterized protein n=1 Tax=Aminobacter carboxidus TaxID=376165 RepID=A0A8E2BFY0_9HYPH|nr:hypothetical protein [Aminobacter lissarensis]MBB6468505.1 hypothetical protein [Aminobacter lissarensis]